VNDVPDAIAVRSGLPADSETCVAVWVASCAARDGRALPGVAERARPKFDKKCGLVVAERRDSSLAGFALATTPGTGIPTDPADAAVLALLAVDSHQQGAGLGRWLLSAITESLTDSGFEQIVLHALADNHVAVRLYESAGWVSYGPTFEHALLKRPMQTYRHLLPQNTIELTDPDRPTQPAR